MFPEGIRYIIVNINMKIISINIIIAFILFIHKFNCLHGFIFKTCDESPCIFKCFFQGSIGGRCVADNDRGGKVMKCVCE
uniref:INVERT_DEFENSINS domain-containing protein n=1 Tax=Strongyloides papillosus TaxID=174720 RepID=A0A0N5BYD9_STREA